MKKIVYIALAIMMTACTRGTEPVDLWGDTIVAIPDWEATPEQLVMKAALNEIIYEKISIEGHKLVLNVDEAYFAAKGLPVEYYQKLKESIEISNKTWRQQNRALRQIARDGKIDKDEADIFVQFRKAQDAYRAAK